MYIQLHDELIKMFQSKIVIHEKVDLSNKLQLSSNYVCMYIIYICVYVMYMSMLCIKREALEGPISTRVCII